MFSMTAAVILAAMWFFIRYVQKHKLLPKELESFLLLHLMWSIMVKVFRKASSRLTFFPREFFMWSLGIFFSILIVILVAIGPGFLIEKFKVLEPMYWMEGISAWPSIILRLLVFFGGVWMLASSLVRSNISIEKLKTNLISRKIAREHMDTGREYGETRLMGPLTGDFIGIFIATVLLLTAMFVTMFIAARYTEWFFTPGRGRWVFFGHEISLILSLATLLLLVWWAALRHYRCRTFLVGLNKELQDTRRSLVIRNRSDVKEDASLSVEEIRTLQDYAGTSSVTLLPPFAMMVLMVVSRHTLFDGWNIPLILIMFLSFMLFILLVSAFQLSVAARNLKRTELDYHEISAEPDVMKRKAIEITAVWQNAAGPFGSYRQQPIVQAFLFAAAGFGIGFIEPMFRFFGL